MRIAILIFFILSTCFMVSAQQNNWVDSVYNAMTEQQRIGQLFMVAAYSNKSEEHYKKIDKLVHQHHIGGVIFFQGTPLKQVELTNRYQSKAKVPLFVAIDGEWGLAMRLKHTMHFPYQMTLGAIQNNELIYDMGRQIGLQCKRIGIHVNFAPVVDVNVNPNNPVIGYRSFGENKFNVTEKARAYIKGLQSVKVLANAKHFPGHGDTDMDSHLALPVISHNLKRLEDIELYPFRELFKDSLGSIMVAHLQIPALDSTPNTATTLSKNVVTNLLKDKMGFEGLIFTDALNMKGVSAFYKPGEVDLKAFMAGNDVLLYAEDVPLAVKKIRHALHHNKIEKTELEKRVKKILKAKYWAGLGELKPLSIENLYDNLHIQEAKALNYELYKNALTVVENESLPLNKFATKKIASISIGTFKKTTFQETLDFYASVEHHQLQANSAYYEAVYQKVKNKDVVIIGLHDLSNYSSKKFGINTKMIDLVSRLSKETTVILSVFGNPYGLKYFQGVSNLICAYEDNWNTQYLVPQLIFGAIGATGKLPVSVGEKYKVGDGITFRANGRLSFSFPTKFEIDSDMIESIDTIMSHAIESKATPGGQILVAKKGEVIFYKNYGHLTYDAKQNVTNRTNYDLASITKVAASTQILMKMYDEGKIDLDKPLSTYLPDLIGSNKEKITLRKLLTHQAGLKPFIPFWREFADQQNNLNENFFGTIPDSASFQVAGGLFCSKEVEDSIYHWLIKSDLLEKVNGDYPYKYSDLGYYFVKRIVEKAYDKSLDELTEQFFYNPMDIRLTYNPLLDLDNELIAPTEDDKWFRKQQIRGYVHDPGAALLNCVAGHAGLFGNAFDLAQLAQMNLNGGTYCGQRYFSQNTLNLFASKQFEGNRRGLGWDRTQSEGRGGTSEYASPACYGHSGFTGTCVWIDPEYDLIYVFLSNRVYPDASNTKLLDKDIRTRIHDSIYLSILKGESANFFTRK